ncbi:phage antirepressor KilAC domain-containing protein [Rudanella paleaurantiibacter]|nr:phage antirepressor KilAC domain-containing protein [Rudanella paleaurantiibacter]
MQLQFDDVTLNVRAHQVHEWAITTAEVAAGFGVTPEAIRSHKSRNSDELLEGKHFVSVANCNAVGNQADTWWTKKGVVRLGFLIKSERAKRFRDWAEDLVVKTIDKANEQPRALPSYQIEDPIQRAEQWIREQKEKQALVFENAELKPQAEYAQKVLLSESTLTTTKIAQELGYTAQALNRILAEKGIQYKQSGIWNLTRAYNGKGYAKLSTFYRTGSDGTPRTEHNLVWTEAGRQFIHSLLNPAFTATPANQLTANA